MVDQIELSPDVVELIKQMVSKNPEIGRGKVISLLKDQDIDIPEKKVQVLLSELKKVKVANRHVLCPPLSDFVTPLRQIL